MPAHILVMDRSNYDICMRRGVAGIPSAKEGSSSKDSINNALISRLCIVKENDYILFYITGEHSLYGIWQAEGSPFFDKSPLWPIDPSRPQLYPYRIRFKNTPYHYDVPLALHDIYDLCNKGKLWNFALKRASGSNAMFSISDNEFRILLYEYSKINPYTNSKHLILEPYPIIISSLLDKICLNDNNQLKYEAGVMAYLLSDLTVGRHRDLFGNYTDYLCYSPTNTGREIDILLMFGNPLQPEQISSYDILELKRDIFDEKALSQLINYETWFLQNKASGDQKMIRSTAIARSFSQEVIGYVKMRKRIENKPIKLVEYSLTQEKQLKLKLLNDI